MAVIDTLSLLLTADSRPMRKELDKAGDSVKRLKKLASAESNFGQFFNILKGGGAVAGVAIAATVVKQMAEGVSEFRKELERGDRSALELADTLASSIPVLGEIRKAGAAIREAYTGEGYEIQKMLDFEMERMKILNRSIEAMKMQKKVLEDAAKSAADLQKQLQRDIELETTTDPTKRRLIQLGFDAQDFEDSVFKGFEDLVKMIRAAERQGALGKAIADSTVEQLQAGILKTLEMRDILSKAKVGNVLGEIVGGAIVGGVQDAIREAERSMEAARKRREMMQDVKAGALGGLLAGLDNVNDMQQQRSDVRFAGLEPAGSGAQMLAMERSRLLLDAKNDPKTVLMDKIFNEVQALNRKIDAR